MNIVRQADQFGKPLMNKIRGVSQKDNLKKEALGLFLAKFHILKSKFPITLILSLLTKFSKKFFLTTVINPLPQLLHLQFTSLFLHPTIGKPEKNNAKA